MAECNLDMIPNTDKHYFDFDSPILSRKLLSRKSYDIHDSDKSMDECQNETTTKINQLRSCVFEIEAYLKKRNILPYYSLQKYQRDLERMTDELNELYSVITDFDTLVSANNVVKRINNCHQLIQAPHDNIPTPQHTPAPLAQFLNNVDHEEFSSKLLFGVTVKEIELLIDKRMEKLQVDVSNQIANCIADSEKRIIERVMNYVKVDYNRLEAKCMESNSSLNKKVGYLKDRDKIINERLNSTNIRLQSLSEEIRLLKIKCSSVANSFARDGRTSRSDSNYQANATNDQCLNQQQMHKQCTNHNEEHHLQSQQRYQNLGIQIPHLQSYQQNNPYPNNDEGQDSYQRNQTCNAEDIHGEQQDQIDLSIEQNKQDDHISVCSQISVSEARFINKINSCGTEIKQMLELDFSTLTTNSSVVAIVTYDLPKMEDLTKQLESFERTAIEKDLDDEVCDYIDSLLSSIRRWKAKLNEKRKEFYLHLAPETNLLKKLDLPKFTGSPYEQTIYSFLTTFFRFAEMSCSPEDQATLLFNTYLSNSIRQEVESYQTDIGKMKSYLIDTYGDLRDIAETRLHSLSQLKHPTSNDKSRVEYFKRVSQTLLHVESLSQTNYVYTE